jgi:hypothetical protein
LRAGTGVGEPLPARILGVGTPVGYGLSAGLQGSDAKISSALVINWRGSG